MVERSTQGNDKRDGEWSAQLMWLKVMSRMELDQRGIDVLIGLDLTEQLNVGPGLLCMVGRKLRLKVIAKHQKIGSQCRTQHDSQFGWIVWGMSGI